MITKSFFFATITGIVIFVFTGIMRKRVLAILAIVVAIAAFVPQSVRSLSEVFLILATTIPIVIWMIVTIAFFIRKNYLAYLLVPFFYSGIHAILSLSGQQNQFLTANAWAVVVFIIAVSSWVLIPNKK